MAFGRMRHLDELLSVLDRFLPPLTPGCQGEGGFREDFMKMNRLLTMNDHQAISTFHKLTKSLLQGFGNPQP